MSGSTPETHAAIVVGAGLAGLTAAWRLRQRGIDALVLEASDRVGGCIRTVESRGFRFEAGPNSMRGSSLSLSALVAGLDLENERVLSNPMGRHAWIWRNGRRHALPSSPPALVQTGLLSPRGKLRLLAEPFLPRWRGSLESASIGEFLTARLGPEAITALVDPFMSGVFAGDPSHLGLDAFPMFKIAAERGGLVRAIPAFKAARGGGPRDKGAARASSFRDGLETLPRALAAAIGAERIRTGARVTAVTPSLDGAHTVHVDGEALTTRRLVLATPPGALAALIGAPELAIPEASVVTVGLGLRAHDLTVAPDGFGVLLASDSPLGEVIGVVLASAIFSGRTPDGGVALTCVIGGVRHPEAIGRSDEVLVAEATSAVERIFGCRDRLVPQAVNVARWPGGIAQIPPGHFAALAAVRARLPRGIALAGAVDGPGLDPVATSGLRAADAVS
ncbi:MAG: protoporphyrinogen oxidase [Deltaproteobacteria bacterium]|nr:protoporphyrinogen oxidase [Deltaproteobacteria bacterium]